MLVLTRKVGERVVIDGNITVTITKSGRNRVTIGIDAPSDVHILRGEILDEQSKGSTSSSWTAEP